VLSPREVGAKLPVSKASARTVASARRAIRELLRGRDPERLLVIVGPCSIHDPETALEYAARLREVARATRDALVVVMRTYFEKPRTALGWKGFLNDPNLDGSCDVGLGIELTRALMLEINELGVPCASELLDPLTGPYLEDLLSWVAIGARTVESQTHRELASGLAAPVGIKNPTSGDLQPAADALLTVSRPHSFLGIDGDGRAAVIRTLGNRDAHLVLRGGASRPNHGADALRKAAALAEPVELARPVVVDCAHANSGKDHERQATVCRGVLEYFRAGAPVLAGIMLESNLRPGRQPFEPGGKAPGGLSITDPCIGWEETEDLVYAAADAARERRRSRTPPITTDKSEPCLIGGVP
jgi:3-deoxy-7-phosphoheptulonate synthase